MKTALAGTSLLLLAAVPAVAQTPPALDAPSIVRTGILHLASGVLTGGEEAPAGAPTAIYDNTCFSGAWFASCGTDVFIDEGRLPSPTSTEGIVGDQESYRVDLVEIGYVTSALDPALGGPGAHVRLSFWESYIPCAQPWSQPQPTAVLDLTGLPGSTQAGLPVTVIATVDLRGSGLEFCMRADGDGAFDGDPAFDSFAWSFQMLDLDAGIGGLLWAGDVATCAVGDGTRWQSPDAPGTGLGNPPRFVYALAGDPCGSTSPFCHYFPPDDAVGFHLRLLTDSPAVCTDPGDPYCFGTDCFCGNMSTTGGCRNTTGEGALLAATGSNSIALDDLVFLGSQLPPDTFALLISGDGQGSSYVGSGTLCITGGLRRYLPVAVSDAGGRVQVGPGLAAYTAGTYGSWQPGEAWNFQLWYRDEPMCEIVTQSHNLSNGYEVVFVP